MRNIITLFLYCCLSIPAYAQTTACIDEDNDGWGWNGVESCELTPTAGDCFDSDPVGDGWGWDGVQSCRIGQSADASINPVDEPVVNTSNNQIDELALIRSKFGADESQYFPGWNRRGVAILCAATQQSAEQVYFLFDDGELKLLNGHGLWSGGWHNDDNQLQFLWRNFDDPATRTWTVDITETGVVLGRGGRECTWIESN